MNKPSVLIAEDEKELRDLYKERFSLESFQVFVADNGLSAIDIIKKEKPDIVLLDIMMPNKDGLEVLREVRGDNRYRKIKIIILSVLPNKEIVKRAKEIGADGYLVKSKTTPGEVVKKIKQLLKDGKK